MTCRTCELLEQRDRGAAPLWDSIVRTEFWDIVHCDRGSLEGWTILVARRHVSAIADLTEAEAAALGPLVHRVSIALTAILGCESTYVVNFAEHPQHRHVHVHIIPRAPDLAPDFRGPGVFQLLNVDQSLNVADERKNELATQLRVLLSESLVGVSGPLTADEACRLEMLLLGADVRAGQMRVDELLHPDFAEFGQSGRIWGRQDTIDQLAAEDLDRSPLKVEQMSAIEIAPRAFLVTYHSRRDDRVVLRSSMWIEHEGRLRIRWHQGTPTTEAMATLG